MITEEQWDALMERLAVLEAKVNGSTPAAAPEPAKNKRGTRVDPSFYPIPSTVELIRAEFPFVTREDLRREHDYFIDYWKAIPGSRGVKLDWSATWRNWMRKAFSESRYDSRRRDTTSAVDQKINRLQSMKD